ncbi:MAG: helix-turn-helix domain-containing protein [Verrucomicrobiales bacterium]|nr:helix-turn-helix domain-containing protein [Verrucomicrobiales bacterium]
MSQSEFARYLGVPVRTVQSWEHGTTVPSGAAATLLAVATYRPEAIEAARRLVGTEV